MTRMIIVVALTILYSMIWISEVHALEISAAPGFMYYTWEEHVSGGNVKESGYLPTITGTIEGAPFVEMPPLRLHGDMMVFVGNVDYDTLPADTETNYLSFKVEGNTGWRIASDQAYLEPFLGLAYRIWERDIKSTSAAQGYPELYRALHGRVGIRSGHKLPRGITFVSTISFDPMIWVKERIDWTSISNEVLRVKNGRRLGWTIDGSIRWYKIEATGYWQATRLGGSNLVTCLGIPDNCHQPKSDQDMVGFKLGYLF